MRFTKTEIVESLDRDERSYRLAMLATHWLRDTARFKPSAAEQARGLAMQVCGRWVSFADLADKLEDGAARELLSSDFMLNQLHTLVRVPFELLSDYCEDFDRAAPGRGLLDEMKATPWYWYTRMIRNAVSHNFHFHFDERDRARMPVAWNGIELTEDMQGKPLGSEALWHKPGYELFQEMRAFADALPELQ